MSEEKIYFSYLLRVWCIVRDGEPVWMASLDDPHTGQRSSFVGLENLFAFLRRHASEVSDQNPQDPKSLNEEIP